MSMEESDLLRSAVVEFADKNIMNISTKIEREGIMRNLLRSIAAQGFLGAAIPPENGGSGIDRQGYAVILKELASYSPSVSALIVVTDSIAAKLIADSDSATVSQLAQGEKIASVSFSGVVDGTNKSNSLRFDGDRIAGEIHYVLNASSDLLLAVTEDNRLVLVKDGISLEDEDHHLAFRGMKYSKAVVDSKNFLIISQDGMKKLETVLDSLDLEVAALALGISRGALSKAVEYTKVRKTFDHPLKDYSPVAVNLSRLISELRMYELSFNSLDQMNESELLMLKLCAVDLAKRATKFALQYHGGYGYIEDFGVEKYYRDAMGLSILLQRSTADYSRLSEDLFGEKSGYL